MEKRVVCPVCGREGTLQEKTTITKAGSEKVTHRRLYCRHTVGSKRKWCYLRDLTPEWILGYDPRYPNRGCWHMNTDPSLVMTTSP